jgi:mRNA-degrading endonuclease YafQ of YafQ-DinJ toxin-antitoxin module
MRNVTKVVYTELFWQTLEQHRKHARYNEFRAVINACIRHKAEDRSFSTQSDRLFHSDSVLKGVWHCKVSRNPDVVFFYRLEDETMICAMVGDHHNYSLNGKNKIAESNLAKRIEQAIAKGNSSSPEWGSFRWAKPEDVIAAPDLHELSPLSLDRLMLELQAESDSFSLLIRAHGPLNSLSEDIYGPWMDQISDAILKVEVIQHNLLKLAKERRDHTPTDQVLSYSF